MKPSVLYLDPDGRQLKEFRRLFSADYDVRATASVEEALWQLEDCAAEIIITDQGVGGVRGGAEFLRKASRLCPEAFRVMVSAHATVGDLLPQIRSGVVHCFVPKPWDYESMRRALERARLFAPLPPRPAASSAERRAAARRVVSVEARVLILAPGDVGGAAGGGEEVRAFAARTYDVSESGVALLIPAGEMASLRSLGSRVLLRLVLHLPEGAVELTARPVREEWLGGGEHLIGAEITDMPGRDRVLYMQYLNGLAGG